MGSHKPGRNAKRKKKAAALRTNEQRRARGILRPLKRIQPGGLVKKAREAWYRDDFDSAVALLSRASSNEPANLDVLLELGRAHGLRHDYEKAELVFDRVRRLGGGNPMVHFKLAETYRLIGRIERATESLAEAESLADGIPPEVALAQAEIHERSHRFGQALDCLRGIPDGSPESAAAQCLKARVSRRGGETEAAEQALAAVLARPLGRDNFTARWMAWYERGTLHDAAGETEAAMAAFERAKKLQAKRAAPSRARADYIAGQQTRLLETITDAHFNRWANDEREFDPSPQIAFLCGHPRSGTTLIEQVLDAHAGLVSADETTIVHDDVHAPVMRGADADTTAAPGMLDRLAPEQLREIRQRYFAATEAFLDQPVAGRVLLDKNPQLTVHLPLLSRVFPEMKIVFALRDPRDVCLSCFMQPLPINPVSVNYLTLGETCRHYAMVMNTWLTVRPMLRCEWIETRYEDVVADLEGESHRLLAFLGLPWDERVLRYFEHARHKHIRSPTYESVTRPVYSHAVGRWRRYAEFLKPHAGVLDPIVHALGYEV